MKDNLDESENIDESENSSKNEAVDEVKINKNKAEQWKWSWGRNNWWYRCRGN